MSLHPTRRLALLGLASTLLAGCGDDEPAQRKAFAAFLQTRILDRPGIHVPVPTAEQTKAFGPYAAHYEVITRFNSELSQRVSKPMQDAVRRGAVQSVNDLVTRRADLVEVRAGMRDMGAELDRQLTAATAARAALMQPADLKPVFDAAYDRDVAQPARVFKDLLPLLDESLGGAIGLADFVAQRGSTIKVQGASVQIADPAVLRDFNARLAAMQASAAKLQDAQRRLQALMSGS